MKTSKRLLSMLLCLCMLIPMATAWVTAEESQPKASENVALGKPVEATSGRDFIAVTDGNLSTYWDSTGGHEANTPSDVVVDLQGWYDLDKVNVITYYGDGSTADIPLSVYAEEMRRVAKEKCLPLVDLHALWMQHLVVGGPLYGQGDWLVSDKCHPSDKGHAAIAVEILRVLFEK